MIMQNVLRKCIFTNRFYGILMQVIRHSKFHIIDTNRFQINVICILKLNHYRLSSAVKIVLHKILYSKCYIWKQYILIYYIS